MKTLRNVSSNQPFASLISHTKDLVVCLSLEEEILVTNPAFENFIGNKHEKLIGKKIKLLFDKLHIDIFSTKQISEIIKNLPIIDLEYNCKHHDDSNRDILWSFFPLLNDKKITEGLILVGRDITELKNLSQQVVRLDNIIKYAPDWIYWKDKNSIHLGSNDQFSTAAGLQNREDIIGKSDHDLPWRKNAVKYNLDDKEVIESGEPKLNIEDIVPLQNGKVATVISNKVPLRDANGQVIGVLGIATDITDRKRLEQNLIKAKKSSAQVERLDNIIKYAPDMIYWKDKNSIHLGCNDQFAIAAGFENRNDVIGKSDHDFPWHDEAIKYNLDDKEVIESGEPRLNIEDTMPFKNGKKATVITNKVPLRDAKGRVIGVLGIATDITGRKKTEEDLRKSKEEAEAASKAKTEFLENMRHDIRTPLTGIVGFADILKAESDEPKIKEYADNLVASSHALLDFLNEILETIRVASGEIPLLKKKFDLKQKLDDILRLNQAAAKQKKLDLQFDYDATMPVYFMGDSKRIQRIVLELVTNALNFTDKGHVKVSVSLAKKENRNVIIKIVVEDTGIGIPSDKQQEIFARFKRLSPSYEGIYKGAGLGLAIIKQFIDDLDGEIFVGKQDIGSVFTCLIPLKESLTDDAFGVDTTQDTIGVSASRAVQLPTVSAIDGSINTNLSRILLVEDNVIAQKMAMHILTSLDCQIDHAPDGKAAIELANQHRYDLIFMDIGLPGGMDGYEVTKRIRLQDWNQDSPVPIIALTAHVDSENKQQCIEAGMNAVLTKPLVKETAGDMLNAFIPNRAKKAEVQIPQKSVEEEKTALFELPEKIVDREAGLKTANGDETLFLELLGMLYKSLPQELERLAEAHKKKDWEAIKALAHKLKGGATYCGALRLKEACTHLDRYLRNDETELSDQLYKQVVDEMGALKQHYLEMK